MRLKWFNQAQFAGFYMAQEKGYYKAAGLDVNIQPGGPDFPAVQMITGGNEQFGVTGADQILIARSKGVPVVAVAVIYRRNPFVLFSLAKSGIKAPADYVGKNVGVKIGGNEELIYRAVLAKAKVDKSKLTEIPVKFDLTPLLAGTVDVWPGYLINEVLAAKEKGFAVNVVYPSDYGIDLYADTLFTTETMLKQKPDVVRSFVAATLKGWDTAIAAPEEAAKITLKYGDKLTYDHELAMMNERVNLMAPNPRARVRRSRLLPTSPFLFIEFFLEESGSGRRWRGRAFGENARGAPSQRRRSAERPAIRATRDRTDLLEPPGRCSGCWPHW